MNDYKLITVLRITVGWPSVWRVCFGKMPIRRINVGQRTLDYLREDDVDNILVLIPDEEYGI